MNTDLTDILKKQIKNEEWENAINVLKNEIIKIYEIKIKENINDFKYTNVYTLKKYAEKYLNQKLINELNMFNIIYCEDMNELYKIQCLTDIYNTIRGC